MESNEKTDPPDPGGGSEISKKTTEREFDLFSQKLMEQSVDMCDGYSTSSENNIMLVTQTNNNNNGETINNADLNLNISDKSVENMNDIVLNKFSFTGSACVLSSFPLIFNPCVGCENSPTGSQLVYYSSLVVLFQLGWASVQISHLSLIPELSPNEHDRTRLTAVRYTCTVLSNVLIYITTWWSLGLGGGADRPIGPEDVIRFRDVVFVGMAVGLVCTLIFHIGVKEPGQFSDVPGTARTRGFSLLCGPQVYQCAVAYMCTRLFVNLGQVFVPLYLHETLGLAAQVSF